MTRRKAIEVAMAKWNAQRRKHFAVDVEDVLAEAAAARAYDLGRITGLREAVRLLVENDEGFNPVVDVVRDKAASLARRLKP